MEYYQVCTICGLPAVARKQVCNSPVCAEARREQMLAKSSRSITDFKYHQTKADTLVAERKAELACTPALWEVKAAEGKAFAEKRYTYCFAVVATSAEEAIAIARRENPRCDLRQNDPVWTVRKHSGQSMSTGVTSK